MKIGRFQVGNGAFFDRHDNGDVTFIQTNGPDPDEGGIVRFTQTFDAGTWGSIVLTMTQFSERPNDWHKWMDHHMGRKDILAAIP